MQPDDRHVYVEEGLPAAPATGSDRRQARQQLTRRPVGAAEVTPPEAGVQLPVRVAPPHPRATGVRRGRRGRGQTPNTPAAPRRRQPEPRRRPHSGRCRSVRRRRRRAPPRPPPPTRRRRPRQPRSPPRALRGAARRPRGATPSAVVRRGVLTPPAAGARPSRGGRPATTSSPPQPSRSAERRGAAAAPMRRRVGGDLDGHLDERRAHARVDTEASNRRRGGRVDRRLAPAP